MKELIAKDLLDIQAVFLRPNEHLHGLVELNHRFIVIIV